MFSRLDAIAFAALLISGSLAVENHRRVDLVARDAVATHSRVAARCEVIPATLANSMSLAASPELAGNAAPAFVELPKKECIGHSVLPQPL